jgi:hypothetical protein
MPKNRAGAVPARVGPGRRAREERNRHRARRAHGRA